MEMLSLKENSQKKELNVRAVVVSGLLRVEGPIL